MNVILVHVAEKTTAYHTCNKATDTNPNFFVAGAHPTDVKDAARADMINDAANDLREAYARMMWTCYVSILNEKNSASLQKWYLY